MITQISENAPIRTVQMLIDEAKGMGLRVIHRPDPKPSNIVRLWDEPATRSMRMYTSPEAA
ncbi:MAG: hypothetical protein Q8S71_03880 [Hydrogenophaga sp.]|nr:hypothetical protein [Hydrogenophaga sp.]